MAGAAHVVSRWRAIRRKVWYTGAMRLLAASLLMVLPVDVIGSQFDRRHLMAYNTARCQNMVALWVGTEVANRGRL